MSTPPQHAVNQVGLKGLSLTEWLNGFVQLGFNKQQIEWLFHVLRQNMDVAYGILWEYMPDWKFTQDLIGRHKIQVKCKRRNATGEIVEIEFLKADIRVGYLVSNQI